MESYCSLCTLDTIHRLCFVTRLIINKINKLQWVDFKLENVLVSLHSLKTMGLGELLGHSPIHHDRRLFFNGRPYRLYILLVKFINPGIQRLMS